MDGSPRQSIDTDHERTLSRMRILAVHRYFWPDTPPYASFLRLIGGRWVADGHQVEILTAQPSYTSAQGVGPRPRSEMVDQLSVSRVPVVPEDGRLPGQLINFVVFPIQVAARILFGPHRDVVMCSTAPQVTLGFAVSIAAKCRRSSFIYHCMDLHPEIGRLSGEFANPVAYNVLAAMDRATMRRASRIVVLSHDMGAAVTARDPSLASKIEVLNNFALPDFSGEEPAPLADPSEGTLRIVFTGNLGRYQGLETVIDALRLLPPGSPVEMVFMGEGKAKHELTTAAAGVEQRPDVAVRFLPHGSPAAARALMRTAHLGLVSLAPEVVKFAYPSKTATYAVEGLPLLVACEQDSELARSVRDRRLGLTVETGDAEAMAAAIQDARAQWKRDRTQGWRAAIADHARQAFDEAAMLDRWAQLAEASTRERSADSTSDVVIIVGAPRSGTNMLRDVLTSLDGFTTWPCDEINLMWKHGNLDVPHDELTPAHARPEVVRYLRDQFQKLGRKHGAHTVVEKTCATSLRVAFAATVFPDAKFIFIRRDGVDAAPSAMKRWNAPFNLRYTLKKVRWVPARDLPRHLYEFGAKKVRQRRAGDTRRDDARHKVATWWGPRPADFRELQVEHPLDEISIIQWQRCVEHTVRDLKDIPDEQVLEVGYEKFVHDPYRELQRIVQFLGKPDSPPQRAVGSVSKGSVGKGREELGSEAAARLDGIAQRTLEKLGYV